MENETVFRFFVGIVIAKSVLTKIMQWNSWMAISMSRGWGSDLSIHCVQHKVERSKFGESVRLPFIWPGMHPHASWEKIKNLLQSGG